MPEGMMDTPNKVYFPGLNGLRFLAALAVIITHIELIKGQLNVPNIWSNPLFFNLGGLGVYFFFVLSGFLITYLLLAEKKQFKKIDIKAFYIRRILRIWPIYYLLIFLGFFVFPNIPFLKIDWLSSHQGPFLFTFLANLFMLPNLALAAYNAVPHIGQAWSIGVEEQFYLIWPLLVSRSRNVLKTAVLTATILVVFKCGVLLLMGHYPGNETIITLRKFVAMSKIECMAIGAAGAYFAFHKNQNILNLVFHPLVQLISYAIIPVLIYFTPDRIQDGIHLVYSFAFLVIIMNVALNPSSFLKLENKILDFLGRISYGIYMYHLVIIVFVIRLYALFFPAAPDSPVANVIYYLGATGFTILVSWLSNRYFEKWFLKRKLSFVKIPSGDETKEPEVARAR
jgi:peptidoglycan/LPS O-acetylase OafA/YrhL